MTKRSRKTGKPVPDALEQGTATDEESEMRRYRIADWIAEQY